MNKQRLITVAILFQSLVPVTFAEDVALKQEKTYSTTRTRLLSGEVLRSDTLRIHESEIIFFSNKSPAVYRVPLINVESIEVATKDYTGVGCLIGGIVGGIAVLIADVLYFELETDEYGQRVKKIGGGTKAIIFGGGVAVGGFVGSTIKGGWELVYPLPVPEIDLSLSFTGTHEEVQLSAAFDLFQ